MVFPIVMYGCVSWNIKKAEHWRIDAFKLWCWRLLLRVLWTARRSNQSIIKEINPEYSLEGLMLKLKIQYLATWCEKPTHWKRLMLGKIEGRKRRGRRGWDGWMASPTQWTEFEETPGDSEGQGSLACRMQFMGLQRVGYNLATEQQHDLWVRHNF